MVHNHINVRGSDTFLTERCLVTGGLGVLLLGGSSLSDSLGLGSSELAFSELSGLSLLQAGVGVFKLEFTENGKGLALALGSEDLWVVDDENKSVSLSKGDTGDAVELLHSDLDKGLSALLLAAVKLGTI